MKWALVLALLAACKGKHEDKPKPAEAPPVEAPPWHIDHACEQAIEKAAAAPLDARPQILIDGCHVCTPDWTPIVRWNTRPQDGGPPRAAIEKAMLDCHAYCDPNAKQRFLGALDAARGTDMRTPWRELATVCKGDVSAAPDARFMGGAYFALDRIARAVGNAGGASATTLTTIELPLPAVSTSGVGPVLPDFDGATPTTSPYGITVLGDKVFVGEIPRAHLDKTGVKVAFFDAGYPGSEAAPARLGEALRYMVGDDKDPSFTLLAPYAMPAQDLLPILKTAVQVAPVYLAANAAGAPEGWSLPANIPVPFAATGDPLVVRPEMTVQQLAGALAQHKGSRVVLRSP
jgi:hypothetical protein